MSEQGIRSALLGIALLIALVATPAAGEDDAPLVFSPAGVSTDRFPEATEPTRVEVTAHDGVALHARVFRPDLYTAEVATDGSTVLRLPVVEDECGVIVAQTEPPRAPIPGCARTTSGG